MSIDAATRRFLVRMAAIVGCCSLLLTASFVGVLAIVSGNVGDLGTRIPAYLIVMAVAFVVTVVALERNEIDGRLILMTTVVISGVTFLLSLLAVEGVYYTIRSPAAVFNTQLVYYMLSAGLVATGLGYWSLNHWREFTGRVNRRRR
ncbi:hypothetical protein [Halolamina rubra]|uniref:hypothetical protein n=1 Tax=Halolamina rubra TaxID=1380430 RepID=UPI0006792B51|nr:hypothetical protein [Halolamina rubra]